MRREAPRAFFLFVAALILYLWSAPPSVVLEDDGLFILAAHFAGIAHPPGYPLHTLLGKLFTLLPAGSVAFRVHALSAVAGAAAVGVLYWIAFRLTGSRLHATFAALIFAVSPVFWSQAIIAEVYSLNALLFLLLFAWALEYTHAPRAAKAYAGALLAGLALANHWPLMALSSPGLLALLWPARRTLARYLPLMLPLFVLGLSPYAWMVLRSQMDPPIAFYGPIRDWGEFWFYLTRQGYSAIDDSLSAGWTDRLAYSGFFIQELSRQVGHIGLPFVIAGFALQWSRLPRAVAVALTLSFLGSSLLLIGLLNLDFDALWRSAFRVYPIIPYAVAALWFAIGTQAAVKRVADRASPRLTAITLGTAVIASTSVGGAAANLRQGDRWAENYARTVLNSLEENAILFAEGDTVAGPVGYLRLVEGIRPDVTLMSAHGTIFSPRLFRPFTVPRKEGEQRLREFIATEKRPVYFITPPLSPFPYGIHDQGLVKRALPELPADAGSASLPEDIWQYLALLNALTEPADPWSAMHQRLLLGDYARLLTKLVRYGEHQGADSLLQRELERVTRHYHGALAAAGALAQLPTPPWADILALLDRAEPLIEKSIHKADRARLFTLRGAALKELGRSHEAATAFEQARQIWPHPDNPAPKSSAAANESLLRSPPE